MKKINPCLVISAIYNTVLLNDTRNKPNKKAEQTEHSQSQGESVLKIIICKGSILITFVLP